ncbi:MAG: hypothetical protein J4O05_10220, partial [Chloroflexi bacterium]|nr:hypothetical protein [Chloroflexota bacterium]
WWSEYADRQGVVEHVRQGVPEHAAGAFDVAEDPLGFYRGCYQRTSAGAAEPPLTTVRAAAIPQGHHPAPRTLFLGDMTP